MRERQRHFRETRAMQREAYRERHAQVLALIHENGLLATLDQIFEGNLPKRRVDLDGQKVFSFMEVRK